MCSSSFHTILLAGVLVWCLLIALPPMILTAGASYTPIADVLYKCFSPICHQDDVRSLHIAGGKLAVCSRCTAIYAGFLIGVFFCRFRHRRIALHPLAVWGIAMAPMIVDVFLDATGLLSSTLSTRLLSGGFFGTITAVILTPIIIQACLELTRPHSQGVAHVPEAR